MFVFVIKNIRLQKKISISKLSQITNISRTYIRDLENNKKLNPTLAVLYSIALALNVNIKDLFYTKFDIDILKQEMYKRIDKYGIKSQETLEVSQLIDLLINIDNKEKSKRELTD
nr:MAG TPA: Helix-turn-helix XRE-family like protein [Caudoviricetes sp.]